MISTCPKCGYFLEGFPSVHLCPECGLLFNRNTVVFMGKRTGTWYYILAHAVVLVAGNVLWAMSGKINLIVFFGVGGIIGGYLQLRRVNEIVIVSASQLRVLKADGQEECYRMSEISEARYS